MYDFVRCTAKVPGIAMPANAVRWSDDVTVDGTTGEELTRRGSLGGLRVTHSLRRERITIEGSLHKYHADGCNDGRFTRDDVRAAVGRLSGHLSLPPNALTLHALEFGVNVTPPPVPDGAPGILDRLHMFNRNRLRPFTPLANRKAHEGKDTKTKGAKYHVKLYDKAAQTGLGRPLLRFEEHTQIRRLRDRVGLPIRTLTDLTRPEVWDGCGRLLLNAASALIWHEPINPTTCPDAERLFVERAGRWEYWNEVKGTRRARQLERYRTLTAAHRTDCVTTHFVERIGDALDRLDPPPARPPGRG